MRIGYLGPEGTFSHEVASAGAAAGDELVALPTNHDVVVAVQAGTVERAVAPVENLIDGAVTAVLDALAFEAPEVSIVGEDIALVRHVLCAAEQLALEDVTAVSSHPVALAQCGVFLRERLTHAELRPAASTAEAVRSVAGTCAAIGTASAAARYGATVLVAGIEDEADNRTRFAWLARGGVEISDGPGIKTSLIFDGAGDGSPGWLVRCLSEFAFRGVNLTRIESRPSRRRLGHYVFHVDCDGHRGSEPVAGAIEALGRHCEEVRVLGTYAAATATIRDGHGGNHST
ncbi:MAG TPA: prephenate dehydratase [Solirubrobacteraceae bacterium]